MTHRQLFYLNIFKLTLTFFSSLMKYSTVDPRKSNTIHSKRRFDFRVKWHEPHNTVQCRAHGSTLEFLFEFQTKFFLNFLFEFQVVRESNRSTFEGPLYFLNEICNSVLTMVSLNHLFYVAHLYLCSIKIEFTLLHLYFLHPQKPHMQFKISGNHSSITFIQKFYTKLFHSSSTCY
jgi:hypothetical protein